MPSFKPCFLIPCYNHGGALPDVITALTKRYEYPIIIIDDGSDLATKKIIHSLTRHSDVHLVTLPQNQGKGAAVIAGINAAKQLDFTHAIQIDADGQHDLSALALLLSESKQHSTALISGYPVYDQSVPKARFYGRYLTHVWVWIETLSFFLKDSMCGFRAYPIAETTALLSRTKVGLRMDFDIDIMVRLYWADCEVRFVKTRVNYPENGLSHFHAFRDNLRITLLHTRLFFGMLPRIPQLLSRSKRLSKESKHWSKESERGTYYGMKILLGIYSLFGRGVFKQLLKVLMFYYTLTSKSTRETSLLYLNNLQKHAKKLSVPLPTKLTPYLHLSSFAETILDKMVAWKGDFSMDNLTVNDEQLLTSLIESKRGLFILGSHLGNLELCRALSARHHDLKINALVFTEHAQKFNAILRAINPKSELNVIQVNHVGPETAILLDEKINNGEWIVIVGDRTSTSKENRVVWTDFLGQPAPFPQGPFLLASILKAPVYLLFGLRDESQKKVHYQVFFELFSERIILPRGNREAALQSVIADYAKRLEYYTMKAPLQWYNFFDFWHLSGKNDDK
ncbi:MAG: putative LPLAT superfamily acyltransferase [Psychromonas sp.]|jgi:predicted LPLAT superfamily acyltransferase|uniref:glycosyltransferase family 2 protein n=1 Tax=Psychromonas sp. TaxID=1884585 RepID=UPI0039E70510